MATKATALQLTHGTQHDCRRVGCADPSRCIRNITFDDLWNWVWLVTGSSVRCRLVIHSGSNMLFFVIYCVSALQLDECCMPLICVNPANKHRHVNMWTGANWILFGICWSCVGLFNEKYVPCFYNVESKWIQKNTPIFDYHSLKIQWSFCKAILWIQQIIIKEIHTASTRLMIQLCVILQGTLLFNFVGPTHTHPFIQVLVVSASAIFCCQNTKVLYIATYAFGVHDKFVLLPLHKLYSTYIFRMPEHNFCT